MGKIKSLHDLTSLMNKPKEAPPIVTTYILMSNPEVRRVLGGVSVGHLHYMVKNNLFPKPYRLDGRRAMWKSSEVQEYLDSMQHFTNGEEELCNKATYYSPQVKKQHESRS